MVSQKPKYCTNFERNSHWRKLSMIMVWERYCNASPKTRIIFIFFVYIFIHISANMSAFGLKFSQMILHTEISKLMYNWSFLFVVLHKPTLLPSTFIKQELWLRGQSQTNSQAEKELVIHHKLRARRALSLFIPLRTIRALVL